MKYSVETCVLIHKSTTFWNIIKSFKSRCKFDFPATYLKLPLIKRLEQPRWYKLMEAFLQRQELGFNTPQEPPLYKQPSQKKR